MGSGCCCCCKKHINYQNGEPLIRGGKVTPCFADGRLFKIKKDKCWYFYNDTQQYRMTVTVNFGLALDTKAISKNSRAKLTVQPDGSCHAVMEVLPLETLPFMRAKAINGFKCTFDATTFTAAERAQYVEAARARVAKEIQAMQKLMKNTRITNDHRLLKAARRSGRMFVDLFFPPVSTSIYRPSIDASGGVRNASDYCWQRPTDYLPKQWHNKLTLFDRVSPTDIDQGALGDCYFLCSCSALAEHDEDVKAIFQNQHWYFTSKDEHKYGAWRVIINLNGWWRQLIVDSYLPSTSLLPSFARNRRHPNELWPSLLEKAYAKAYGSYQAIEAGFPWQAQEDLTGYPAFSFDDEWEQALKDEKTKSKLFKQLGKWSKKDYLITIATPAESKLSKSARSQSQANREMVELFDKAGLATGHAYSVLDVKHFPVHDLCLLKIRNPWGNGVEWTGDWSDNSRHWKRYPLIKMACRPEKKADGVFWMEWNDVTTFFDTGSVCFRETNWLSTWHNYRVISHFEAMVPNLALEIHTKKECTVSLTLHQKDRRGLATSDKDTKYAAIMLSLCEGERDSTKQKVVVNSSVNPDEPSPDFKFQTTRSVSIMYDLQPNKRYLVLPRRMTSSTGNNEASKKYILSLHTKRKLSGGSDPDISANFVRLDKGNDVFRDFLSFDMGTTTAINSIYQVRHGVGFFSTHEGTSFTNGRK
ncbi:calpain family cysteine protease-like protein [Strigomonas culicis]|uniref:Calpain family cysteine protease-like protein n=1 Tax=Strigomonas culicis TaxID=28005 RepID=S9V2C2_9TRYP|nr:calpain family cysteine protease-like protein [Strigomonas culicis]|eukprot:EPY37252.1 calpain family cysteine protease-like protein [Strigomonas culicis]